MNVEDPMFSSRTDHELLSWYNGAIPRARAMGLKVEVVKTFPERQLLIDTCEALHNDMTLHAAAAEAQEAEGSQLPVSSPNGAARKEQTTESSPLPKNEKSKRKSTPKTSKTAEASAPAETPPAPVKVTKKETTKMAAQATATATAVPPKGRKAAAAPAPAPAPKGRKAAAAPAPAPEPKKSRRTDFDDNAKITWNVPKNEPIPGAHEGSAKWARWDLIRQHNGKKVSVYKANGGNLTSLANAIEKECASVG